MRTLLAVLLTAILGCSKIEGLKTELVGKTEIKMVSAIERSQSIRTTRRVVRVVA